MNRLVNEMAKTNAWDSGMLAAKDFKRMGKIIGTKPIFFGGIARNIPREKRRKIAKNARSAKAGTLLSTRRLNNQWLGGFFGELKNE